ncbi:MAG: hypothetical protein H6510_17725 [Acidobacteria bacterium]|nr:hypothetical protein [Acidobacteriota bacterium]MCB9399656.1 hypothetical protein [Acidobacteriota bacterium]
MSEKIDPQNHLELSKMHVDMVHKDIENLLKANAHISSTTSKWSSKFAQVAWGGMWGSAFNWTFDFSGPTQLIGGGAGVGPGVGVGLAFGSLTVNVDPKTLIGKKVNFQYTIGLAGINLNFWDAHTGAYIGTFIGLGAFGASIGGGTGHL